MATRTKKIKKPGVNVYARLPDAVHDKLQEMASGDQRSMSFLIREAIEWWLKLGAQKKTA